MKIDIEHAEGIKKSQITSRIYRKKYNRKNNFDP